MIPTNRIDAIIKPMAMRTLERDKRGYPIPFIAMRDRDGTPHFTINDADKVAQCITKRLCAISGKRLTDGAWFVGGPRSFLHPAGAFLDPPVLRECGIYALQVCPFLAMPHYGRRIDGRKLRDDKIPDGVAIHTNTSAIVEQPPMFCIGSVASYEVIIAEQGTLFKPVYPWRGLEFWHAGRKLEQDEWGPIAKRVMADDLGPPHG